MKGSHQKLLADAVKLMGRRDLAAALEVSEATLETWLNGEHPLPSAKLRRLADAAVKFASKQKADK